MSETNKALARRFQNELFVNGNLAVVDELVADDYVDHSPMPGGPEGKAGLTQIASVFRAAFPDMQLVAEDVIAEGDKVVMRNVARGTHTGELMGIAPTGRTVTINEIHIVRFAGGKIV